MNPPSKITQLAKVEHAYADAIATYLAQAVSRLSSTNSVLCRWNAAPSKESVTDTFSRQALSMVWEFAEGNPFTSGPCELNWSISWVARAIEAVPAEGLAIAQQLDASTRPYADLVVSTDPPYYDNIGYSDVSTRKSCEGMPMTGVAGRVGATPGRA